MTEELDFYKRDRAAWAAVAAPRWVPMLEGETDERVLYLWRAAGVELKRAVWALAGIELRERIRRLAKQKE